METLRFQAETTRLLDLVIHSLYTQPEIFLRELIANASDALDRFHVERLVKPALDESQQPLEVLLAADRFARTLTVRDNGIGMSRAEVVAHIGTIARSGSREALERADRLSQAGDRPLDLIGRFGVGFYSTFMVADRVTLVTRRADEPVGTRWESTGTVEYTLADAENAPRGTAVTLHLKPADNEAGLDDYTDRWTLSRIVKRYADFVTYPIVYSGPTDDPEEMSSDQGDTRVVLNSMKPIWLRPESQVPMEEYRQFYSHITHDWDEPLLRMTFRAEGRWEYIALVFAGKRASEQLYYHAAPYGLHLYAHRLMIAEDCADLLPRYLRFLKGVIDAADLELNVSRQSLRDAHHLARIRKWLTRKVLDHLIQLRDRDKDAYLTFWQQFGRVLKEGASEDHDNSSRLLPLFLFQSSHDPSALTTLAEYVGRMKEGQGDIYYLTGESRAVIEHSPHLERLSSRGYEVLYLTDPVDELLVQAVWEFEGHRLRSVAKGNLQLGGAAEREEDNRDLAESAKELEPLFQFLGKHLASHVTSVRVSTRLTRSPACLAVEEFDDSPQLERLLLKGKGGGARQRRVMEINPQHSLVRQLAALLQRDIAESLGTATADLLFGYALLAEGSELLEPTKFNERLLEVLGYALEPGARSSDLASTMSVS